MTKVSTSEKRLRLKGKIRARISGTNARPRLSVFKSNKFIYAQIIDDINAVTLVSASDIISTKGKTAADTKASKNTDTKTVRASAVGEEIASLAKAKGIETVVFDRNGFKYAGRVKALADGARKGGLTF